MPKTPRISIKIGVGELLRHVPTLVKAYGKWPSYIYLFVATLWTPLLVGVGCWSMLRLLH